MKLRFWLLLIVAILGLGAAVYYANTGGYTPAGQPPLARFGQASFDQRFRAAFGEARLLVLLSPT
jgi:hypothetical protein